MGPAIVIITPHLTPTLIPAHLGKDILPLELGITPHSVGHFNHLLPIFGFITVMIEVEMVAKLFG